MAMTAGDRFRVYGADSAGEVVGVSGQNVSYRFDHAPDTIHSRKRDEFERITYRA